MMYKNISEESRSKCYCCGKVVSTLVPQGGDGSSLIYVRHKNKSKKPCSGSRMSVK